MQKHKILSFRLPFVTRLCFVVLLLLSVVVAVPVQPKTAAYIPDGCFGSAKPVEPRPGVCATIPVGCPGSSLQGPPSAGSCESIPAGCPGSTKPNPVTAPTSCPGGGPGMGSGPPSGLPPDGPYGADCIGGDVDKDKCDCNNNGDLNKDNCTVVAYLLMIIRVLSGLVGIVVIMMVIIGGVQYSTARNDPQAIAAARGRITNALLALLFYLFIFAILQWLVPGGVL